MIYIKLETTGPLPLIQANNIMIIIKEISLNLMNVLSIKLHGLKSLNNLNSEDPWNEIKNNLIEGRDNFVPKIKICKKKPQPVWMNLQIKKINKPSTVYLKSFLTPKIIYTIKYIWRLGTNVQCLSKKRR